MQDSFLKWFYHGSSKNIKLLTLIILGPSVAIIFIKIATPLIKLFTGTKLLHGEKSLNIFLINTNFILHIVFLFVVLLNSPIKPNVSIPDLKKSLREIWQSLGFDGPDDL